MSAFSTYSANKVLDHMLKVATWTAPTNAYVGLFTSDAGLDSNTSGSWTEVSGGAYARVDASAAYGSASAGSTANTAELSFPTATAPWGDVTHWALLDAATAGNVLFWSALTGGGRTVQTGDGPRFAIGDLTLNVT